MRLFETIREIKALNKKRKEAKAELAREKPTDAEQCANALRSILDDCVDNEVEIDETEAKRIIDILHKYYHE